jgi:hypothetical protein
MLKYDESIEQTFCVANKDEMTGKPLEIDDCGIKLPDKKIARLAQ